MAFSKKIISVTFTLGSPTNVNGVAQQQTFDGVNSSVTVSGLRTSCKVVKSGGSAMNRCELRIFGLTPNIYNSLVSVYPATQLITKNTVSISAGDSSGMSQVFYGQITIAQIDLNSQPDCVLNIVAQSGLLQNVQPINPVTYPNSFSLSTALASLASTINLNFESNGVNITLPGMTLTGTGFQQYIQLTEAAKSQIYSCLDDVTIAIWYKNSSRQSTPPLISPNTGMVGYPTYSNIGIGLKTEYNPNIIYGGKVQCSSSINIFNGIWTVYGLSHTLESEMPNGQWFTEIQGYSPPQGSPT